MSPTFQRGSVVDVGWSWRHIYEKRARENQRRWRYAGMGHSTSRRICTVQILRRLHAMSARTL